MVVQRKNNSELFSGSNFRVISRFDKSFAEHGGVRFAALSNHPPIFDLSIKQYPSTFACVLVTFESLSSFILLYQPSGSSSYRVPPTLVNKCFAEYQTIFYFVLSKAQPEH